MQGCAEPSLTSSLEPLTHCRNVASLSLFYWYYFGRCSSELAQLTPLPYSQRVLFVILIDCMRQWEYRQEMTFQHQFDRFSANISFRIECKQTYILQLTIALVYTQSTMFQPWETQNVKTVRVKLCIDAESLCFGIHKLIRPHLVCAKTLCLYNIFETINLM